MAAWKKKPRPVPSTAFLASREKMPLYLHQLSQIIKRCGGELRAFSPQDVIHHGSYDEWPIHVVMRGQRSALLLFFKRIVADMPLLTWDDVRIENAKTPENEEEQSLSFMVFVYTATTPQGSFKRSQVLSAAPRLNPKPVTRGRMSVYVQQKPVRQVLQKIARCAGINMIISESVKGTMTLDVKHLPWRQVLDSVLKIQGLSLQTMGSVYLIDTQEAMRGRLQKERQGEEEEKKIRPLVSRWIQINYAQAKNFAIILKNQKNSLLSERGTLSVDDRTNMIWIQDQAANLHQIEAWIRQVDRPRQQVMIEAKIVNVTKDLAHDLGVRWGRNKTIPTAGNATSWVDQWNLDLAALPLAATPASVGMALTTLGDHVLLDLELSALESEGRAKIIASPRLMTTHQKAAVIESGEEIPYQESTASGATSVSFKKAVLRLQVTPQITPHGQLLLDLVINQDSDSGQRVQGVPVLLTKSLQTQVLVYNGQTIVLGGINRQDRNKRVIQVPVLGRVPWVGHLFSQHTVRDKQEELLIFVTTSIVHDK